MTYDEFLGTTEQPVFEEPEPLSFEFIEPDYKQPEELDFFNENAHERKLNSIPEPANDADAEALFDTISIPAYKNTEKNDNKKASKKNAQPKAEGIKNEAVFKKPAVSEEIKEEPEVKADERLNEGKEVKEPEVNASNEKTDVAPEIEEKVNERTPDGVIPDLEDEEINDSNVAESTYILDDEPEEENGKAVFTSVKMIAAAAAMFVVLISVPFIMNLAKKPDRAKNKTEDITVTTEEKATVFDESTSAAFNSASSSISTTESGNSSRFDTIDDLTFYLSANMASTLSAEKQLVKQYASGQIDYSDFIEQMNTNISAANELQHLLVANKNTYKNAGLDDQYEELSDYSDTLIVYGDKAVYEAGNGQIFTTEK